jgi:hypothetical protein
MLPSEKSGIHIPDFFRFFFAGVGDRGRAAEHSRSLLLADSMFHLPMDFVFQTKRLRSYSSFLMLPLLLPLPLRPTGSVFGSSGSVFGSSSGSSVFNTAAAFSFGGSAPSTDSRFGASPFGSSAGSTTEAPTTVFGQAFAPPQEIDPSIDKSARFKVILVGDAGVGKTAFVQRLNKGDFLEKYARTFPLPSQTAVDASTPLARRSLRSCPLAATIGIDVQMITMETSRGKVLLKVWDVAGDSRFGGLREGY